MQASGQLLVLWQDNANGGNNAKSEAGYFINASNGVVLNPLRMAMGSSSLSVASACRSVRLCCRKSAALCVGARPVIRERVCVVFSVPMHRASLP